MVTSSSTQLAYISVCHHLSWTESACTVLGRYMVTFLPLLQQLGGNVSRVYHVAL